MEELDSRSKPSEESIKMLNIPDDLNHESMNIIEHESIGATMDAKREGNSLESDTCHWRNMLKLCTPLSIRLTHLSKDILKKFTGPKKNVTQKPSGSSRNLIMDSRDYRSKKRRKKNVSTQFRNVRKKQKTIPDNTNENSMLKSSTVTTTNNDPSASAALLSEEHTVSKTIANESLMNNILNVSACVEPTGKDDTSSVECINENIEECTQVEKNSTETEESRYQEYVRNILMEYCCSYGNLSHMSKELHDDDHSSDTKSITGVKRPSDENHSDDQILSWNSRKRRKKIQLNSQDTSIVNRKSPKKKQQRNQKNLTLTPTKGHSRSAVFRQQTKSHSSTPSAAKQNRRKTSSNTSKELKVQLMKLEDMSDMYVPIESANVSPENERVVSPSLDNGNGSEVGLEGISDAETVVNSRFTEENRSGIEFQESDHDSDSTRIIAYENKSVSGSEILDVFNEMDLDIVEKQRRTSMSSDETVHQNGEADNCVNEVDEAIDVDTMLRQKYCIRNNPVVLLERLNPSAYRYSSTNVHQYDYDVSDVLEESDSSSSDSEIFMFVKRRKSTAVRSRRISSDEEADVSPVRPIPTPVSNKDKDAKSTSPISRASNVREEPSELLVTNQTSGISRDTSFVKKRKSTAVRSRRISSDEDADVSPVRPIATPVSNKDKDAKSTIPICRASNIREEPSELLVTNQTSGISKDTSLERSEPVTKIATLEKKKVSQTENTNNLSPKKVNSLQNSEIIEYPTDSSDSDIQILSMTVNSDISPKISGKLGMISPSSALSPQKSPKLHSDNNGSSMVADPNQTPIANTQTPVGNEQTPSSSKITPVGTTPKLSCQICNRKYVRKRSLKIHMQLQHNKEPCDESLKPGTTSCMTQESSSAVQFLDCGICSRKFLSKKAFVDHVFSHQSEAQQDYRIAPDKRSQAVWLDLYGLQDKNIQDQHIEKSKKDKKDPSSDKRLKKEEQIISSLTASPKEVVVCSCHPNDGVSSIQDSSIYIEMVLLCEYCNVVFRRKECLETHYRVSTQCSVNRTSGRVPKLYCTACNVTVESLSVLCHHLEMHPRLKIHGTVTFVCNICKVIFFGIGSIFRRHWFSHLKNPLFVASRHSFPKISVIKALGNYNVSAEERKQVVQAAELAEKIKYVLVAEHVCRYCKLPFGSEIDLTNHSTSCSGLKNTTVPDSLNDSMTCSACQKTFTDKTNYEVHVNTCHAMADGSSSTTNSKDTANYSCNICCKICQTEDQLMQHQDSHKSADLFLCSRCGVSFSTVEHFTNHTQVSCTICDKQFDCQKRYQDHLSNHFTNLVIDKDSQESPTKTGTSCETNIEVQESTKQKDSTENMEESVSSASSNLQAKRPDQPQQPKFQNEVRYLIIRENVAKSPKKVITITSEGSTSNSSCASKEAAQQIHTRNEISSASSPTEGVMKIVENPPDNQEKDPLPSEQGKNTTTTMDTEVPTDSSETSSTTGMPCSSKNEKTPRSGFLRVKSMSELLEKRDKKSYICKTCGLPCTSVENLAEHSRTHVTHQTANKKTPSINDTQCTGNEDSLKLLNQYICGHKLTLPPRSNINNVSANNVNNKMNTNVSNTLQANINYNRGGTAAFIPCVICGTIFNVTENPVHCQTATTSTGQVNMHTNATTYHPVATNQIQSAENVSTFNTAVRRSPFVEYTSNTIGREKPPSVVNNSANVNLNMNQQVTQPLQNSQWITSTYSNRNVPITYNQVSSRAPPPYSASNNVPSNILTTTTNSTTTGTSSHCIVPNPPTRPQYPYRAVSQSGSRAIAARRSTSSSSSSASFTNNNAQPVTTDASIRSTGPPGYSTKYNLLNVPLQQSQSDITVRTESHVIRQPAHQSISEIIHHLPEQPSQLVPQQPAQLSNFITQPKTTQAGQQTSQQTTIEQPHVDSPRGPVFSCSVCKDFTCTTIEELRLHRMRHTTQQRILPRKSYCTSTSDVEPNAHSSSYSRIIDQQPRSNSSEPLYVCNGCHAFRTNSHVELQEHMKVYHKSYICQLCHIYKCKSMTQMQEHINLHIDGKIAPHAVRHNLHPDGKGVSKKNASQSRDSPSSESSQSTGARSSPVDQVQPTRTTSKQYAQCEFRSSADPGMLDHGNDLHTLSSFSNDQAGEQSGLKRKVYFFCKVCEPTPIFPTVADLHQHQANVHP